MEAKYSEHRKAFIEVLYDAQIRYRDDIAAGLSTNGELIGALEAALAAKGGVRLFKYQPFSERNLQDCEAGVLHLSKLGDLNDINEGLPWFDRSAVEHQLSSVDVEQAKELDLSKLPQFIKDRMDDIGLVGFAQRVERARESGELERVIAPSISSALLANHYTRRDYELCGSLSATERSASMWDRYGDRHRGFAVGYTLAEFTTEFSTIRSGVCQYGFKALLAPVFYGERVDLSLNSAVASIHDPALPYATNMETLYLVLSLLQKAEEWEHEQEWRVIANACPAGSKVHYCKMRPDSVYLGLKMQPDERKRIIDVARKNGWQLFEMKPSHESLDWSLEVQELRKCQ